MGSLSEIEREPDIPDRPDTPKGVCPACPESDVSAAGLGFWQYKSQFGPKFGLGAMK